MTGVDLTRIDGVDGFTALKVISEIGTDMTTWPSAKLGFTHFKRRRRGNLQAGGTGRLGVPAYRS